MIFQDFLPFGFTIITFIPLIIGFGIRIICAVIIAKDAQKRQLEPTLYIVITCLCGCCVGPIIYLIVASNHPVQTDDFQQPSFRSNQGQVYGQQQTTYGQPQYQQPRQPTTQTQPKPVYPDANTTMPNINVTICPICGSQNQKNAKYCSHCGADLK